MLIEREFLYDLNGEIQKLNGHLNYDWNSEKYYLKHTFHNQKTLLFFLKE